MRVIVTRPEREALQWARDLRQHGLDAHPLPLMAVGPIQSPDAVDALTQAWHGLSGVAAVMFVSANAVRYFFCGPPHRCGVASGHPADPTRLGPWPRHRRRFADGRRRPAQH